MADHSKWSKVQHLKGPLDQKRGQHSSTLHGTIFPPFPVRHGHPAPLSGAGATTPARRGGITTESPNLDFSPEKHVQVIDADVSAQVLRLIETLEDSDGVQHVEANFAAREESLANSVG